MTVLYCEGITGRHVYEPATGRKVECDTCGRRWTIHELNEQDASSANLPVHVAAPKVAKSND